MTAGRIGRQVQRPDVAFSEERWSPFMVDFVEEGRSDAEGLAGPEGERLPLGHRRRGGRDQLGKFPEVLGGSGEEKLVSGAAWAA